jgi:hypothetical protein
VLQTLTGRKQSFNFEPEEKVDASASPQTLSLQPISSHFTHFYVHDPQGGSGEAGATRKGGNPGGSNPSNLCWQTAVRILYSRL